jgi:hypothetical protein
VKDLSAQDQVICVQLALFAAMMKSKDWTPKALQAVGGARGAGVAFLKDSFDGPAVHPLARRYKEAAIAMLDTLLPATGTTI